ncbi:MAG: PAS domain-containing sensor histidine kinase [Deltaproteobacteria bacterium]|nr:MAG: PAS domain-containing sensor histidine kinase [Deltaproteobacteria bacterium]
MRRKRLLWKLYPAYLAIILLSIATVGIYASTTLKKVYLHKTAKDLEARARLIEKEVAGSFTNENRALLDLLCKTLGRSASTRITLILPSGEVLGDSEEDPRRMDNHAHRPEVKKALAGQIGVSTRYSHTLRKEMMYVAIPVIKEGKIIGVVRTSIPVTEIDTALSIIYREIALGGVLMIILAAAVSLYISRRISQPLEEMKRGAKRFAEGDFTHRLLVPDSEELGGLAEALNQMAQQLDEKIRVTTEQRNELEAILSGMREGVLAIDTEERILMLNHAAGSLLGIDVSTAKGHTLQEMIRNADLQRFLGEVLTGQGPTEAEIVLHGTESRFLQVSGTVLSDSGGRKIGALVVLNDITKLRHLEDIRREFVANVSHELKTPITSVKGFVETLREGAIDDKENARKFLEIISKQADRLNAIIEDLLSLSRIEQEAEKGEIQLMEGDLRRILEAAILDCETRARERNIKVTLNCSDEVRVKANSRLLEQAVSNLLDNALKYSEPGGIVEVEVIKDENEVAIKVRDHGYGIPPGHLPRLFERFYRVDKARSRELGGTGLGLAIVKHIVQAHGGHVTVESTLHKGSTFTIHLPNPHKGLPSLPTM